MKIGIDGYEANTDKRVGIGQYAYQLLIQLQKLDKNNDYTVFLPGEPYNTMPQESGNWHYAIGKPQNLWTIRQLPALIKQHPVDIFFSPTHFAPWFTNIPQVLSLMDLSYLHYPEMFRKKDLLQLKYMGQYSIKKAQKILTISEFSKYEIVKYYSVSEKNITVTYPGVHNFKHQAPSSKDLNKSTYLSFERSEKLSCSFRSALQNSNNKINSYILFVGTIQPRKNIKRLIEAFELINDTDTHLLLAGKKGWLYESIFEKMEKSPKRKLIIWLDYINDSELPNLYKNAVCLALPSLYEGFGIPVVEAMSYGCPVVISNTTSLPEVAGDAGIYVDPVSSQSIAQGITKALQLSKAERSLLSKKGKEQAKKFTWKGCAQKTIEVFNTLSLRGSGFAGDETIS